MRPVPLIEVEDEARFGGKAVQLGSALRAGLPVPSGVALEVDLVDGMARGEARAIESGRRALAMVGAAEVAVRSSAVGEDSAAASFAGQHLTRLNVRREEDLVEAVMAVWASGRTASALAYRERLGIEGPPRVAVVVQALVAPDCAGVLFTRNPVSGADERLIEATWGLGEAVVAGLVEPDRVRMRRGGTVVEHAVGDKDVAILPAPGSGTLEVPVEPSRRRVPCLDDRRLARLEELASRCESLFAGAHDLEWAFEGERLVLLQRRAVTR